MRALVGQSVSVVLNKTSALLDAVHREASVVTAMNIDGDQGFPQDLVKLVFKVCLLVVTVIGAVLAACGCKKCMGRFEWRKLCGIGVFLRKIGYDTHDPFDLIVVVHEARYNDDFSSYVRMTCKGNSMRTIEFKARQSIEETLPVHIGISTTHLLFELVLCGGMNLGKVVGKREEKVLARGKVTIEDVINFVNKPGQRILTLLRTSDGKKAKLVTNKLSRDPEVVVTFAQGGIEGDQHILEGVNCKSLSPAMQFKLQQATNAHQSPQDRANSDHDSASKLTALSQDSSEERAITFSDEDQLNVLSRTCEGPLKIFERFGRSREFYIAIWKDWSLIGNKKRSKKAEYVAYSLGWWKDKAACESGDQAPAGTIQLMSVTNILTAQGPNDFILRYQTPEKRETHERIFSRVDRSRDLWVESLRLFLEQLRLQRSKLAEATEASRKTAQVSEPDR